MRGAWRGDFSVWIKTSDDVYTIRWFYPVMRDPAKAADRALTVFREHGGMLRTRDALRLGIHPRTLYLLRDRDDIEQISRGLYRLSAAEPLASPDLVPIAIRVPRGVVCLISALAYHGLTTQVPHAVDIALPSHARVPKVDSIPVRVFWFAEPAFSSGVEVARIDEVPIRMYSPEKTIADCFKYRNKIGLDVAIEALRTYRERTRKPKMDEVLKYARVCRVERVMRPYLEAVL